MKKSTLPLLLLISLATCSYSQQANEFKWLVGTWKINLKGGSIVERWKFTNDSTFTGKSFFVKNNSDSIPQELLEFARRKGRWNYISKVQGQNNNLPVSFEVITEMPNEFIAVNPTHDFPQRIAYRKIGEKIYASIEGKKNGKYRKENFDFSSVIP